MLGTILKIGIGGALVWLAYEAYQGFVDHHGDKPALPEHCTAHTTCPVNMITPSPTNGPLIAGKASALGYRWCVEVVAGDTAGSIAKAITGDARRYLELLAANPTIPRKVDPATNEVNFDWPKDCTGLRLLLPFSWNPWMDQTGKRRGGTVAFPPFDVFPPYPLVTVIAEGHMPDLVKGGWL